VLDLPPPSLDEDPKREEESSPKMDEPEADPELIPKEGILVGPSKTEDPLDNEAIKSSAFT
jgi:hypothetical protein